MSYPAPLFWFSVFLLAVVIGLTGCVSSTLDKALSQCAADSGLASYTRAEGVERFQCAR
jgi:hypothetical protein